MCFWEASTAFSSQISPRTAWKAHRPLTERQLSGTRTILNGSTSHTLNILNILPGSNPPSLPFQGLGGGGGERHSLFSNLRTAKKRILTKIRFKRRNNVSYPSSESRADSKLLARTSGLTGTLCEGRDKHQSCWTDPEPYFPLGRLRSKLAVMPGSGLSCTSSLPTAFPWEKGLEMLCSCLWNKHGTSKSGLAGHSPLQSSQTYEPRGGRIWSHPQRWAWKYATDQNKERQHWVNANFLFQRRFKSSSY